MLNELDSYRAKKVICDLAKAEGVDEKEIRLEMEKVIEMGYSNPDPSIRKIWNASPFRDVPPSPEEFILWCTSQL